MNQIAAAERVVFVSYEERRPEVKIFEQECIRPLNPADAGLFEAYSDLGAIIRDAKLCDAYNSSEVGELAESWAHHILIVFRSGYQTFLHCGKSLTKMMGRPVDVALAQYDVLLKLRPDVLDDHARCKVSIADAVLNMA